MKVISETTFSVPDEGISETTFSVPDDGYFRNDLQRT
jgi:hypothetical protein